MNRGIDSVDIDMQPIQNNNVYWGIFFIVFIILSNFLLLNLFAGVVVSTFNREKDILDKNNLLSEYQKGWLEQKKLILKAAPKQLVDYGKGSCK